MTVANNGIRVSYNGDGTSTVFAVPFQFLDASELVVVRVAADGAETTLAIGTEYTVGGGEGAVGSVTTAAPPAAGARLVIYRNTALVQGIDYQEGDSFPANTHELGLDRATMQNQEQADKLTRAVKLRPTTTVMTEIHISDPEPGKALVWTETGQLANSAVAVDEIPDAVAAAQVAAAAAALAEQYAESINPENLEPADPDILKRDEAKTLTVGFDQTVHALGDLTGALAPDVRLGSMQEGTVAGGLTINAPARDGVMELRLVNTAAAYSVSLSGYTRISGEYTAGGSKIHLFRLTRYGATKCIAEIVEEIAA